MLVDTDPAQLDPAFFGEHQPGHEVGVVLHVGEEHGVAWLEVVRPQRGGHQVDGLGGVLREDHFVFGVGCPDEAAHGDPGRFVAAVGLLGDRVDAAVDVGVGGLVVVVHGVENRLGRWDEDAESR